MDANEKMSIAGLSIEEMKFLHLSNMTTMLQNIIDYNEQMPQLQKDPEVEAAVAFVALARGFCAIQGDVNRELYVEEFEELMHSRLDPITSPAAGFNTILKFVADRFAKFNGDEKMLNAIIKKAAGVLHSMMGQVMMAVDPANSERDKKRDN